MSTSQKITVEVPSALLEDARRATGQGITETVRRGLELVARSEAYGRLRGMRGKLRLSRPWQGLKHDRR